jgi:hypothetical protein
MKERTQCAYNTLPFDKMPAYLTIEMAYSMIFCWLNMFPLQDGISKTHSLRSIIVGLNIDYRHHCQLEFGNYVQMHEEHTSSMATRTNGAIALRPAGK